MLISVPLVTLLTALAQASPHGHKQHGIRKESHAWRKIEKPSTEAVIPLRIGLKQQNLENGEKLLLATSDPTSDRYGRHYTPEEIMTLFQPE